MDIRVEKCRVTFRRGIPAQKAVMFSYGTFSPIITLSDDIVTVKDMLMEVTKKDYNQMTVVGKILDGSCTLILNGRKIRKLENKF